MVQSTSSATGFAAADDIYRRFAEERHIPGIAVGIVQNGQLVHTFTHGLADIESRRPVTTKTRFRIASMTKNTTSLAILMLRDAGKVSVEVPVGTYVPELKGLKGPTSDSPAITLRDLMSHTAGWVTDDPWGDRQLGMPSEAFSKLMTGGGLFAQTTGITFEYSNFGYAVLGRVISNVTGQPYQDFIRDKILHPLGMMSTTFDVYDGARVERATGYRWARERWTPEKPEADGAFGAMGGLETTVEDYAKYVAFILDAWPARDGADAGPASRATRRELAQIHSNPGLKTRLSLGETISTAGAYGYGLVSVVEDGLGRYLHHPGGLPGYGSSVVFSPETGIGIFAFGNVTYAGPLGANLDVADALRVAGIWKPRPKPVSHDLQTAAETVAKIYTAGRVEGAAASFAVNLLPDFPAEERNEQLAKLKAHFGEGKLEKIEPQHRLAGKFVLKCARGDLTGELILTPGPIPQIQTLMFHDPA